MIDTAAYIERAKQRSRKESGKAIRDFSRCYPDISNAQMTDLRRRFNQALDELMEWATSPKDVEITLRHEASHVVAACLLGLPPINVDLVPRVGIHVEQRDFGGMVVFTEFLYASVYPMYPPLEKNPKAVLDTLTKLAVIAAMGGEYENKMGYDDERGLATSKDREKIDRDIAWAEHETGLRVIDPDALWKLGQAGAKVMVTNPGFLEMVEAVAKVLGKYNGKQAVNEALRTTGNDRQKDNHV
jgi:hypothetical protein